MDRPMGREANGQTYDLITKCPLQTFQDWSIKRVKNMNRTQCELMPGKKGDSPTLNFVGV